MVAMASSLKPRSTSPFRLFKNSLSSSSSNCSPSNVTPQNHVAVARSPTPIKNRALPGSPASGLCKQNSTASAASSSSSNAPSSLDTSRVDLAKTKECIAVTVRFRPLNLQESERGDEVAWYPDGEFVVRSEYNQQTAYAYDKVFDSSTTTAAVYDVAARHVVQGSMDGVNGIVFAYGVTSSGKTHTMHGDQKSPGIITLAVRDVFRTIQDTPGREYLLRVSYIEIYNEIINDLLDPSGQNLRIREDSQGTYVEGIVEEVVLSPAHALSLIAAGEEHRHVGSNNFNVVSSRSHTIFTMTIESSLRMDDYDEDVILSQLSLIDLAGSESSKTDTTGIRRKEGSFINKSLLTLGTVIAKLSDGKPSHVPFRDSKLTRLLQPSLSGGGRVSLICTITPASSYFEETHNTLKFAHRAKRVEIHASCNRIVDEKSLIKKYQREIDALKEELDQLKRGMTGKPQAVGTNCGGGEESLLNLRLQMEAGRFEMQSRLQEEEQEKEALLGRIQKLGKLILVSTKNSILNVTEPHPAHKRRHSFGDEEASHGLRIGNTESKRITLDPMMQRDLLQTTAGPPSIGEIMADQVDLVREQIKMLAGEAAFCTSSLKRMLEKAANSPDADNLQDQIQKANKEILDKKRQIYILEKFMLGTGHIMLSSHSPTEMSRRVAMLMSQMNEVTFELEIKTADNRILQEQLQAKAVAMEKLKQESIKLIEENGALQLRAQKLADEASYATDLASAAAMELQNLAEEVTKLSFQNVKLKRDLTVAEQLALARPLTKSHAVEFCEKLHGRKEREGGLEAAVCNKENMEAQLHRKLEEARQKEAELESDLAGMWMLAAKLKKDRESFNELYGIEAYSDVEQSTRDAYIDKDLNATAHKIKVKEPESRVIKELKSGLGVDQKRSKTMEVLIAQLKCEELGDLNLAALDGLQNLHVEALTRLCQAKAKVQQDRERERENGTAASIDFAANEANEHICKVCFEAPTAAVLLPCRHFSLCKACAVACAECPLCRSKIADRIIAFTA